MAQQSTNPTRPPRRDIIVIGASSGGIHALLELAESLPHDFPAPIFVVQHIAPDSPSILPELLGRVSALEAKHPTDGEEIKPGVIYVARPDHHLLVEDDKVLVRRGPKENRFRSTLR